MKQYSYLWGTCLILLFWLFLFWRRRDLRQEMLAMSFISLPAALTDFLFVPEYWRPITLFDIPVGIEGFAFCFGIGGIAAVLYEGVLAKSLIKHRPYVLGNWRFLIWLGPLTTLLLYLFTPLNFMYDVLIGMAVEACIISLLRRDLTADVVFSGLFFAFLYSSSFVILLKTFPQMLEMWSLENLGGIFLLGVPLEEILWALMAGAVGGPLYEFWQGYRLENR